MAQGEEHQEGRRDAREEAGESGRTFFFVCVSTMITRVFIGKAFLRKVLYTEVKFFTSCIIHSNIVIERYGYGTELAEVSGTSIDAPN